MSKSMKEIYSAAINLASTLDGWKETGFVITTDEDVYTQSRKAIEAASEILPGVALSYTLQIAEAMLGTKDGEALESYLRNDMVLVDTLNAELHAYAANGTV